MDKKTEVVTNNSNEKFKYLELDELYWFIGKKPRTETKENVYLIAMVSRNPRKIVGFDVAADKSSQRIQNIVDSSPRADFYCTSILLNLKLVQI